MNWLKRIRGAVLLGLAWAVLWAPAAVLIGTLIVDPDNSMDEMWLAIGAYPGFLSGALFSAIRGIAERGRALAELPPLRAGSWGAVSGLLVGTLPFLFGTANAALPLWQWAAVVIGPIVLLSAISAIGSKLVADSRVSGARKRQA